MTSSMGKNLSISVDRRSRKYADQPSVDVREAYVVDLMRFAHAYVNF